VMRIGFIVPTDGVYQIKASNEQLEYDWPGSEDFPTGRRLPFSIYVSASAGSCIDNSFEKCAKYAGITPIALRKGQLIVIYSPTQWGSSQNAPKDLSYWKNPERANIEINFRPLCFDKNVRRLDQSTVESTQTVVPQFYPSYDKNCGAVDCF